MIFAFDLQKIKKTSKERYAPLNSNEKMAKIRTSTITYDPYKNIMNVRTCSFDNRFLTGVCSDCVIYQKQNMIKNQINLMKVKPNQSLDK